MELEWIVRNCILLFCFVFIGILFLKNNQEIKLNWALFYAVLWISISLAIVNFICVQFEFWEFTSEENTIIQMPFDLFFVWIVFWGIVPFYFFRGKKIVIILLVLFWIDMLFMPELEKLNVVKLSDNWLVGELLLLLFVFTPSYLWAKYSYNEKRVEVRALLQVLIMTLTFLIGLPYIIISYTSQDYSFEKVRPILFQIGFIITFPSLMAVQELVVKGKGTPFPYDKTKNLVNSGVYAYCRNPIQWSFTLLFIPLSIYYNSWIILLGLIVSIAYTIGVSEKQEYEDMADRFGEDWVRYKKTVPKWRFLWKPKSINRGNLFFKRNCAQCEQLKKWFQNKSGYNLNINYSDTFKSSTFLQVTYIDNNGLKSKGVKAISYGLEHINLAYACLGWFMRFPIIFHLLQAIINSMDFEEDKIECDC